MKTAKLIVVAALCAATTALVIAANDVVTPATASKALARSPTLDAIPGAFYKGTTLLLTNMQCFSDAAGVVTQGLTGVAVYVTAGPVGAVTQYTGTVNNATAGLWWCSITAPTNTGDLFLQVKLIDASTNTFIYPWINFWTKDVLQ